MHAKQKVSPTPPLYVTGGTVYWDATSTDAWGHYQDETFGNDVATYTDFDQASGLMASREGGVGGGTGLIHSIVKWDDLNGNLTERQDLKLSPAVTEVFEYDSLSRLDRSTRNGSENLNVNFDAIGNITSKGGQTYLYTGPQTGCSYYTHVQPRAVRKIGTTVYCYDKNGNMVKRAGSNISYTSYNLPSAISSGSNSSTLSYGAFRNRFKQVAVSGGTSETTVYVGGLFEKVTRAGGVIEYRHTIPAGKGTAAIHTRRTSGVNSTYYVHGDHLGSPELITDNAGAPLVRPSFGAYGERRDGTDWNGSPSAGDLTAIGNISRRGFTDHEHLDSVGLIHMNGRVYDPVAGRFLGVDPILGVGLSQDVNSNSYVWNSPLSVIDPSGYVEDDPTPNQCIGADFCPSSNPPPSAFDDEVVIGSRVDTPLGGWGSASGADLANQMASWGTGITLAIDLNDGAVERQISTMDDVTLIGQRIGPSATFSAGGSVLSGSGTDDQSSCDQEMIDRGNRFVEYAGDLAVISGFGIAAGLGTTFVGGISGQPQLMAAGALLTTLSGGLGAGAAVIQLYGGALQGYGGADYQNAYMAAASIGGGVAFATGLARAAASSGRAMTRAADASWAQLATTTGGLFDIVATAIDQVAPNARKTCSR